MIGHARASPVVDTSRCLIIPQGTDEMDRAVDCSTVGSCWQYSKTTKLKPRGMSALAEGCAPLVPHPSCADRLSWGARGRVSDAIAVSQAIAVRDCSRAPATATLGGGTRQDDEQDAGELGRRGGLAEHD